MCVCVMHMCFFFFLLFGEFLHTVHKKSFSLSRSISLSFSLSLLSLSRGVRSVLALLVPLNLNLIVRCAAAASFSVSVDRGINIASFWRKQDNDPHRQTGARIPCV